MPTTPRIAIVGAGPGGLLCARVLQLRGLAVEVYDADASVDARDPGGTLDLHADTGQIALEDAGLLAEFAALARTEGQAKRTLDRHGKVLAAYVPDEDETAAPEIDRGQLRALLAAHVRPGTVRWGHKLVAATALGAGTHRLEFANGAVVESDLVIGADGAWSRVRPLLTDAVPRYTGVSFLDIRFDDVERRHPGIAELVGDGHMFANGGDGRAIIGQRNSNGVVRGYVGLRTGLDWYHAAGVDLGDTAAVRRFLLGEFAGWADTLLPFIADSESFTNRAIQVLPAPLTWAHTPGATLLGDAAHVMSPFGGFGMNLALLDGAELAHALAEEPTVDAAVARYETAMFARTGPLAVGANEALDRFFGAFDPADIPDQKASAHQYKQAAAVYRRRGTADGTWTLTFPTPAGERQAELVLATTPTVSGTLDGTPIENPALTAGTLTFTARITSPVRLKLTCTATLDGPTLTGTAKSRRLTFPFTGTRQAPTA
ncbi:FAD-dependent monooxygenase [Streptomyces sp. NBC_01476]|uniref:FAD-dependent oxidoreductase n=1 Tax=Streptomyces sp. NBC_01476 TaxID=2903881 RepID=UPI002E36F18C|nr:NAD(P)/FAD-dependent oxidoreductase [Streptomyces sp. NBC_01476]